MKDLRFRVQGSGCRGLGFREFEVWDCGSRGFGCCPVGVRLVRGLQLEA